MKTREEIIDEIEGKFLGTFSIEDGILEIWESTKPDGDLFGRTATLKDIVSFMKKSLVRISNAERDRMGKQMMKERENEKKRQRIETISRLLT